MRTSAGLKSVDHSLSTGVQQGLRAGFILAEDGSVLREKTLKLLN